MRTSFGIWRSAIAVAAAAGVATVAMAADITGAGATFPFPIYAKWAAAYKAVSGVGLNYQSIGSGGGIKQIKARTVTFGASDMPLTPKDLDDSGLTQFPTVVGGVVPVYNLPGIRPGALTLDGPTLAAIYMGKIARWNDAAIAKLNPGMQLPAMNITAVHRSDGSGTTFIFANYLSQVSDDWKKNVGAATSVEWTGGIGAKGNEGVAGNVAQTVGALGYVEYAYVIQNKLSFAKMINRDGKTVAPEASAFASAAAGADWAAAPGFYLLLTNEPGAASWPIAGATFILIPRQPPDPAAANEALKFFSWAYKNGDKMAQDLDYVPLPANVKGLIEASWKSNIKTAAN
jgi:phosphate transport system substrate-binding protein